MSQPAPAPAAAPARALCAYCNDPAAGRCYWPVRKKFVLDSLYVDYKHDEIFPPTRRRRWWLYIPVIRRLRCDRPVCEKHGRELGETKHLCAEHWDGWKGID